MIYAEICESNQYLFGQLEQYTREIYVAISRGEMEEAELLQNQKEGTRALINANLELLEKSWSTTRNREHYFRKETYFIPVKKEQIVIGLFTDNPNLTMKKIGELASVSEHTASRIITNYLTHKYGNEETAA